MLSSQIWVKKTAVYLIYLLHRARHRGGYLQHPEDEGSPPDVPGQGHDYDRQGANGGHPSWVRYTWLTMMGMSLSSLRWSSKTSSR